MCISSAAVPRYADLAIELQSPVAFDEKAYFQEKPENRPAKYPCPRCKRVNE